MCDVEGCDRPTHCRGWCRMHYSRWQRHGDPLTKKPTNTIRQTQAERFWPKVEKDGPLPRWAPFLGPCWLWTAALNGPDGYGRFGVTGRSPMAVHRWAYEDLVGPIPSGLDLDHLCRVHHCVRPSHLEPVTRAENLARGVGAAATRARHAARR